MIGVVPVTVAGNCVVDNVKTGRWVQIFGIKVVGKGHVVDAANVVIVVDVVIAVMETDVISPSACFENEGA